MVSENLQLFYNLIGYRRIDGGMVSSVGYTVESSSGLCSYICICEEKALLSRVQHAGSTINSPLLCTEQSLADWWVQLRRDVKYT